MALCYAGPYGHPSGRIEKLVFYTLNGQPVCRLIGKAGKPSINQMANLQAMSVTMALLKPMSEFINVSFKLEAEGTVKNPHNLATFYNKKLALTGQYPNIKVDYSKVVLSKGKLEMTKNLELSKEEGGINLSWDTSLTTQEGRYDEIMMVMVSHPDYELASSFLNASRRADGSCFIPLQSEWLINGQMETDTLAWETFLKFVVNLIFKNTKSLVF
ncbi:hypothetical protein H9X96_17605 [Pedobacter sp. N36a]|uniref:DUF6266 family protein n=1 Tax=Pedobacter sp. N36a TaxID=2767996 RepID=UPI0016572C86|nr:DUF6266 family protein [Pedobacter sp. N36a]MBC8987589.1 hypothetical protein [Pedobacter sp. N36a]